MSCLSPSAHAAFFSQVRTDLQLVEQSGLFSADYKAQVRDECERGLDTLNLIYPPTLERLGFERGMPYKARRALMDLAVVGKQPTDAETRLLEWFSDGAASSRKAAWQWRISQEAVQMDQRGWFPFFVTLTVDPRKYDGYEIFGPKSRHWQRYLRRVCNVVTKALGHRPAHKTNTPPAEYMRYVAVVEHGQSGFHHHAHALIWLREIPDEWKLCPNRNVRGDRAIHRRCKALETLWPYCISSTRPALYYRSVGDIWSRLGHVYPLDANTRRPMVVRPPEAAGAYLSKYMQKGSRKWKHRTKATRSLGLRNLIQFLNLLPMKMLDQLARRPQSHSHCHILTTTQTVPTGLLRSKAKWHRYCRRMSSWTIVELLEPTMKPWKDLCASVNSGMKPWRLPSEERFDWVQSLLPPEKIAYSEDDFFNALEHLMDVFPRIHTRNVQTIGNYHG